MNVQRLPHLLLALSALASSSATAAIPTISAGETHSLYLKSDSSAWAAGNNTYGQLGASFNPNPVGVIGPVQDISAGYYHSLFLKEDGTVWACGLNTSGQLGIGNASNQNTPQQVTALSDVQAVAAGHQHSLFLKTDGSVWGSGSAWGTGLASNTTTPIQIMTGVKAIAAGYQFSHFLKTDGSLWAAGQNNAGQLGDGSTTWRTAPVATLTGVKAMSCGYQHALILMDDDSVRGTGLNNFRQLGDGTTTPTSTPVSVMTNVQAVSAGGFHSMFLKNDGSLWTVGRNDYGQCGNTTFNNPQSTLYQVTTGGVLAISAGHYHSLFLKDDNNGWSFGQGGYYQLGTGSTSSRNTPVSTIQLQLPIITPTFTTQPESHAVNPGINLIFTVVATGTTPLFYQWNLDGTPIPGATSASHSIVNAQLADEGAYTCTATNAGDSTTSDPGTLTILLPPTVTGPPATATAAAGSNPTITVSATGTTPFTYQWKKNGTTISGATSATLQLTTVGFTDETTYTCVVTNVVLGTESSACALTVTVDPASPDTDGDELSDAVEHYFAALGLDPATHSGDAATRLAAVVPELGEFYTATQMQSLAVGDSVVQAQPDGSFSLELFLRETTDLDNWVPVPISLGDISITNGRINLSITPSADSTKFYSLGAAPGE